MKKFQKMRQREEDGILGLLKVLLVENVKNLKTYTS